MSFGSPSTSSQDRRSPSGLKPADSAVLIEARFQGSTYAVKRWIGKLSKAQELTRSNAFPASPLPLAEAATQHRAPNRNIEFDDVDEP